MINWALVEPARVWIDPQIGIIVKPDPKPIQMAIVGPKVYRFGLSDPDFV
jgi:hypothetical protein